VPRKRTSRPGPYLLHIELLRDRIVDADKYPFNLPAVRSLTKLAFHPRVTYFIGENGSGKSTLMEAIAVACGMNAEGGSSNFRFSNRASHSSLNESLRIARPAGVMPSTSYFLRAESYFNVATEIERLDKEPGGGPPIISYYGGKSLHEQSHGESFFALFLHRFGPNGLYFLDEPEAALSPKRQLQFLALLHRHIKNGSQLVIATHSPILMAYPDACIYRLDADGIRETAYVDTEHYQITRGFLESPARSLKELMRDDEE
jgi:predicted ATPase